MAELLFLVGLLVGGVIVYLFFYFNQKNVQDNEQLLRGKFDKAGQEIRELKSRLSDSAEQIEQLQVQEAQLQQNTEEHQNLVAKLAAADKEIEDLREQLAGIEGDTRTVPEAPIVEEPESVVDTSEKELKDTEVSEGVPESVEPSEEQPESAELPKAEPESVETAEEPAASSEVEVQVDNLRKIEGIGPKVASILNESGIESFAQLAQTEVSRLREILQEAGSPFKGMTPDSWPEQAALAAKDDWDALKELQAQLDGGRYKS